jgi:hypothetical protein
MSSMCNSLVTDCAGRGTVLLQNKIVAFCNKKTIMRGIWFLKENNREEKLSTGKYLYNL